MRFLLLLPLLCAIPACASVDYAAPEPDPAIVEAYQRDLQREAIDVQLKRRARLYDLAWPVLTRNAELCEKTRRSIGVVLAGREDLGAFAGGIEARFLEALGYTDDVVILHVMAGSPAAGAGLSREAVIRAVEGEPVNSGEAASVVARIIEALDEDGSVTLAIEDEAGERSVSLDGVESCDVPVKMSTSDALNAMAATGEIVIHGGLMRAIEDDDVVQFVIAHELAHIALAHRPKVIRNSIVSGAFLYGPLLYTGGALADTVLRLSGSSRPGSLAARALAASVPYMNRFEAEADYVGLYMLARAGGDIDAAPALFSLFAAENPESTWLLYTHPITPARYAAVEAAVAEVKAKIAGGEALLPQEARD